jgi:hypothetical protein
MRDIGIGTVITCLLLALLHPALAVLWALWVLFSIWTVRGRSDAIPERRLTRDEVESKMFEDTLDDADVVSIRDYLEEPEAVGYGDFRSYDELIDFMRRNGIRHMNGITLEDV